MPPPPRSASSSRRSKARSAGPRSCRGRRARSSSGAPTASACLRQVPAITELAQLDSTGKEQLKVSRLAMDVVGSMADFSQDPKFTEAVAHKVYYGPVYFRRESEPYMTLALAGTRRDAGVSVAEVNLKLIWDVILQIKCRARARLCGRWTGPPDRPSRHQPGPAQHRYDAARAGAGGARRGKRPERGAGAGGAGHPGQQVLTAYAPVTPLGWLVFAELPIDEAYAPLYASIERSGALLFGALVLAFLAGLFLARRMVGPIQALRAGAARIGSGNLSQRISIKTGDELEGLADQFNDMAGRLQESYADLEEKVEVRTRELSETLAQQTATADVLQRHQFFARRFEAGVRRHLGERSAICGAEFGNLALADGNGMRTGALYNAPPEFLELRKGDPVIPLHRSPLGRLYQRRP